METFEKQPPQNIKIFGLAQDSIVDGPGLRFCVFVQGCSHGCKGCHNPESHDPAGGILYTTEDIYEKIRANGLIHAVTFSGGEPFEQPCACAELAKRLKDDGYNIWAYTGYLFEDLLEMAANDICILQLLENVDVVVDGPYIESLHSYDAHWRGSTNQRIIDVPSSLSARKAIELVEEKNDTPKF